MSWDLVKIRTNNSGVKPFDEGGILCQCCPPFLELRRGGRYIVSTSDISSLKLTIRGCNTHSSKSFGFQLKYSYNTPVNGGDVFESDWNVFKTYNINPETKTGLIEEDVSSLVSGASGGPIYFAFVVSVDYDNNGWPTENDCDFSAIYQIVDIVCDS